MAEYVNDKLLGIVKFVLHLTISRMPLSVSIFTAEGKTSLYLGKKKSWIFINLANWANICFYLENTPMLTHPSKI